MALPNSVLIVSMLVFGSYNTLNTKWQFATCAPTHVPVPEATKGCDAGERKFHKPWLQTFGMFIGEASLMVVYGATQRERRRRVQAEAPRLLPDGSRPKKTPFYIFGIPAFCDVFGTGLAAVALQYIPAALWQMLRAAIIIFSAVLSYFFLDRPPPQPFQWVAVGIVSIGLITVGLANVLDPSSGSANEVPLETRVFGMVLVVLAQLCAASQMVIEEKLSSGAAKTSAKKVVGCEGLWGMTYMTVVLTIMTMVPGEDDGKFESFPDSMTAVTGSPLLVFWLITYMASISVYNLTGITVGKKMSAVVRCLVDSCRTVTVWGINLILYYLGLHDYGEAWTKFSWLTVIGFLILIIGTLLYNEVLPAPASLRRVDAAACEEDLPRGDSTLSNILSKDPLIGGHIHTDEKASDEEDVMDSTQSGASLSNLESAS